VVTQNYLIEVNNEHVIKGNSAVIKCSIPSFVADFVTVFSWHDNTKNEYSIHHDYTQGIFIRNAFYKSHKIILKSYSYECTFVKNIKMFIIFGSSLAVSDYLLYLLNYLSYFYAIINLYFLLIS